MKQSGGYVWVYSELGKGTSFKVYLPRADDASSEPISPDDTPCVGTETVLVVEDEDAVRLLTRRILEEARYRVFDAPNPQQAEELFGRHPNRSACSSLMSSCQDPPDPSCSSGWVRRQPNLRVLYVSGYTDPTMVDGGQLDPGVPLLQKPFAANALKRRVREVLDGH